jgi:hypothetical protein
MALLHGIIIDPATEPVQQELPNTPAVTRHMTLCKERVEYYADIGALELLEDRPDLLQPLHVVTKPGRKPRLVLDLSRNLNDLLVTEEFHHPTFQHAVEMSHPGCFYGKMDLANCFLSFDIHPASQRYLAFELDGTYYRFKRLPFGLSTSPFWCEQILSVIDFILEERGVRHLRYCDDFLFTGSSAQEIRDAITTTTEVLAAHGLAINHSKTEGPVQRIEFLGLGFDSVLQQSFVPDDKRKDLLSCIKATLKLDSIQRVQLQRLVGKFSFASTVLHGSRPFFRYLINATKGLPSKFASTPVTASVKEDLRMWQHILKAWDGNGAWSSSTPEIEINHDASKSGFGFTMVHLPLHLAPSIPFDLHPGFGFAGRFSPAELVGPVRDSIQWAELFAIACSLALYGPFLRNRAVLCRTDNLADVHIIISQSTRSPALLPLLRAIYSTCAAYNIKLHVEHIPGVLNVAADLLSRPALHAFAAQAHIPPPPSAPPLEPRIINIHHISSSSFELPPTVTAPAAFPWRSS